MALRRSDEKVENEAEPKDLPISWFMLLLTALLIGHVFFGSFHTSHTLKTLLIQYFGGLGAVLSLYLLSWRTVRWRGGYYVPSGPPHPRFPTGKHPRPRLQIFAVFSVVLLITVSVAKHGAGT